MRRIPAVLLALPLVLALPACSSDDGGGDSASGPTTTAAGGGGSSTTTAEATTTTAAPDPCTTDLRIVNAQAETELALTDRAVEPVSVLADQGPHPDNTVDYDETLELAISEVEIVEDPQFGLGIPIGTPDDLTGDAYYLSLSFQSETGPVSVGQVYDDRFLPGDPTINGTDDTSGATTTTMSPEERGRDGKINFVLLHHGEDRLLPGDVTVTITELTDDRVCGEIAMATDTELQTFIGLEGTFAADRIQALEAAAEG